MARSTFGAASAPKAGRRSKRRRRDAARAARQSPRLKSLESDEPVVDIDKFRCDLARRLHALIGQKTGRWRDCPERVCQRARGCAAPRNRCSLPLPGPPPTADQIARTHAELRRAFEQAQEVDRAREERAIEASKPAKAGRARSTAR